MLLQDKEYQARRNACAMLEYSTRVCHSVGKPTPERVPSKRDTPMICKVVLLVRNPLFSPDATILNNWIFMTRLLAEDAVARHSFTCHPFPSSQAGQQPVHCSKRCTRPVCHSFLACISSHLRVTGSHPRLQPFWYGGTELMVELTIIETSQRGTSPENHQVFRGCLDAQFPAEFPMSLISMRTDTAFQPAFAQGFIAPGSVHPGAFHLLNVTVLPRNDRGSGRRESPRRPYRGFEPLSKPIQVNEG